MTTARRTSKQNLRYWALVSQLPGLRDEEESRRAITLRVTGKVSTADCSVVEMNGLCQYLEYMLGKRTLADVELPHAVSIGQKNEINALEHSLDWDANPNRLAGFLLRQTKGRTDLVDELKREEAQKVLNGLRFIRKRELEGAKT